MECMEIIEKKIVVEELEPLLLFGYNNSLLNIIESRFVSSIVVRGNTIAIRGESDEVRVVRDIFKELIYLLEKNNELTEKDVHTVIDLLTSHNFAPSTVKKDDIGKTIYHGYRDIIIAKSEKQQEYHIASQKNDILFAVGPAGTGKTFLAVAMALAALKRNEVSRIILTRPAVEAGESLGFLPGDLNEKIDPYLRPLMDALQSMLSPEKLKSMREKNIIEINPLAYMRGRTLNNSFIILDEAQNTTTGQMKMFLTRLGQSSRAIITGDVTQIDLPKKSASGLIEAEKILIGIKGISFIHFDKKDVVRHKLVAEIIRAYEVDEREKQIEYSKSRSEKSRN